MMERKTRSNVTKRGGDYSRLRPMLMESMVRYHWSADEFFLYHYEDLTPEQRRSFVPEYEKNVFCNKVNDYRSSQVFKSKWLTYQAFREFFGRDCCLVSESLLDCRDEKIMSFLSKHSDFISRPSESIRRDPQLHLCGDADRQEVSRRDRQGSEDLFWRGSFLDEVHWTR